MDEARRRLRRLFAAGGLRAVPRSLAAAPSPALGGALFVSGWLAVPLALSGGLEIGSDLALGRPFRCHSMLPPEDPRAWRVRSDGAATAPVVPGIGGVTVDNHTLTVA